MYHLEMAVPAIKRLRIPFSRDQLMLLMVAFNELMLSVEIYVAHSTSGTITSKEWIPIIFGPIAAAILGLAGLISLRKRVLAMTLAIPTLFASLLVGLLGVYFHFVRAVLPYAPFGQQANVPLFIWAPPILAPLTFALVAAIGLMAIWVENPVDSGNLVLFKGMRARLPFSKTRGYYFFVSLGLLATLISSVLDHARTNFSNPWLWVPTAAGIFGTVIALLMGVFEKPSPRDIRVYIGILTLIILVGVTGVVLHLLTNLTSAGVFVGERFMRGAPILAPLLFADLAGFGLIVSLDPDETSKLKEYQ
ncbi:MAG: hypothetical protein A2X25_13885 [Chloroflexi bacterium GWB2_49_20]|nr:MAG: hypothetical protein A2X25_13885 [Chloroflexi bacterium GWB2_49_20]OGN79935.1 MAG: hypothetical protein A2X26_02865 [Chloroflexi bacterium GWC2_49_37]OGN85530.1 MAG: hypothetical protein A2X27_04195 [Chloroflexi bacterium GWD2_49_16]HBG74404.1 hypothetical protein [Anaerolineae bacterium]HCM96986.1 hypothetical protein [Anaerolineae bacterium]